IRSARAKPHLDRKIVTEWNGLAIAAFARAARVTGESAYADRAARAADFVLKSLSDEGDLLRRWVDGEGRVRAFAEDYAAMVSGLLELHETTLNPRWLAEARRLHDRM